MTVVNPHFESPLSEFDGTGRKPFVFDILSPDGTFSLLSTEDTQIQAGGDYSRGGTVDSTRFQQTRSDYRMVLYTNPKDLSFSYTKKTEVTQTMGGWVETYWGDEPTTVTLTTATGGFIRVGGTGLTSTTGAVTAKGQTYGTDIGGNRRETLQYDKMLDFLAMFHNNGSIYDDQGNIIFQGKIKMYFDQSAWTGWFNSFNIEESAEQPFMFSISAVFQIETEIHSVRTFRGNLR